MRAVAVTPGKAESARIIDLEDPAPAAGECLVRVLEVGIDGTDREIDAGAYGEAPEGSDHLVLGHECLGVVEHSGVGDGPREGTLVVPTVRRPCPQRCPNCEAGAQDFCSTGDYRERGIKGAHGYMCERFSEHPQYLVPVPEDLRDVAVLLEPFTILQRSYRLIGHMQERLVWTPRRVCITGAGNMGVIAAFLARLRDLETLVYSKGEAEGVVGAILAELGCEYVDANATSLRDAAERTGAPDIAIEATGFSPLAWEAAGITAVNGVTCLLSVTQGGRTTEIPSDELNTRMVLGNRLVFGSVNAHRRDFDEGVNTMRRVREQWPGLLERFITHRRPLDDFAEGLRGAPADELKTVLEVDA